MEALISHNSIFPFKIANLITEDLFRWTNISPETALVHFLKYTMEHDNRPFFSDVTWRHAVTVLDVPRQRAGFIFKIRNIEFLHWKMRALNIRRVYCNPILHLCAFFFPPHTVWFKSRVFMKLSRNIMPLLLKFKFDLREW